MGVYLYTNTYTYNFLWKTTTQVWNDGWTVWNGSYSIESYWLHWTGNGNNYISIYNVVPLDLSNATKVTQTINCRHWSSGTAGNNIGTAIGSSLQKWFCVYNGNWSWNNIYYGNSSYNFTQSMGATWPLSYSITFDLVAKTLTLTYTVGSTNTYTRTMTDTDVNYLKQNDTVFIQLIWTNEYLSDISVKIE